MKKPQFWRKAFWMVVWFNFSLLLPELKHSIKSRHFLWDKLQVRLWVLSYPKKSWMPVYYTCQMLGRNTVKPILQSWFRLTSLGLEIRFQPSWFKWHCCSVLLVFGCLLLSFAVTIFFGGGRWNLLFVYSFLHPVVTPFLFSLES